LAQKFVRNPERDDIGGQPAAMHEILDFIRADPEAAGLDERRVPADEPEIAIVVHAGYRRYRRQVRYQSDGQLPGRA
jgi:hypothetical protein